MGNELWQVAEGQAGANNQAATDETGSSGHLAQATPGLPVGIDVGTSKIVIARNRGAAGALDTSMQLNAFIPVPYSGFTEATLTQRTIPFYRTDDELVVYGTAAEQFANMFNAEFRRPMAHGMLNPREPLAMPVLENILKTMLPSAQSPGQALAFSVPAADEERAAQLTYYEATLRQHFDRLGYRAKAINEGMAVIFAELADQNFTGIGISCGGGMCNVAVAFLSIPHVLYSVPKGGDFIDEAAGTVLNEHAARVKVNKEESLDLSRAPKGKFENALHVYYRDLVKSLVTSLRQSVAKAENLPHQSEPIPIVLSGGVAKPRGFKELFEQILGEREMPIQISEVRVARDPLTATARGALIAAKYER